MNPDALAVFRELADRSPFEREAYYAQHQVTAVVRAEVESVLRFDRTTSADSLHTSAVSAAETVLSEGSEVREGGRCGPYRLVRLVGRGGMGAVYEAEQDNPRRIVALKVIKPGFSSPELVRRFAQESQTLGRLQHPGIAQIYEAGTADTGGDPQPYFAMEFIRGQALKEYCESRHLNTRERLELMARVSEAVHHAHQRGIIHRDLKPGNILVDETGQPKILDFGVARVTDSDAQATRQTDVGQLIGTLAYMSPEQVLADPLELDTRSDVYSLGVILYELLAGRLPYDTQRKRLHEVVRTIREEDPASLGTVSRIYRGDIETIVGRALEKEKDRRYSSAADLAGDIRRYLRDEPVVARPPSVSYQLHKFTRRHRALVAGVAAVFLVLVAGVLVSAWQAMRARRAEQTAIQQRDRATDAEQAATRQRDRALSAEQAATNERNRAVTAEEQAILQRNRALAEKKRGDTESATARAINDFLENDVLAQAGATAQAGPNTRPDPDLKVRTALDRAAERIAGRFEKQPVVEASLRFTIGRTYRDLGALAEAQRQLEGALDLLRRTLGAEDVYTLDTANELALTHQAQGKYAEAEPLLAAVLDVRRRRYGEQHTDTLAVMNNLALLHRLQGKYALAEPLQIRLVDARRRTLGEEHPSTLINMVNLGLTYMDQGKYVEAEPLHTKVLEVRRRTLGEEHPSTQNIMRNLATLYSYLKKNEEAEQLLTRVLDMERRVRGEEHPDTLRTLHSLAAIYAAQSKTDLSESTYKRVVEGRSRVLGGEHPDTLTSMTALATLYLDRGQYRQAELLIRQALQAHLKTSSDAWSRFNTESILGAALSGQQKYGEAEPLLLSGHQGMSRRVSTIPASQRVNLQRAAERIVQFYQNWGKPEKAAEWRATLQ